MPLAPRLVQAVAVVVVAAIAVALAAGQPTSANTTNVSSVVATGSMIGWLPCSPSTFADSKPTPIPTILADGSPFTIKAMAAQCASIRAPLCYAGICDNKAQEIELFVKRIPAKSENRPNIIFMQGGPGAASPTMELAMVALYGLLGGQINVYTMDHRGTGRSNRLDCVTAQATTTASMEGSSIAVEEVPTCAKELDARYGPGNLAAFSITSAASDLKHLITKYIGNGTTYVYGVSYGTALVERLMHLETPGIGGYILDGVSTTSGADVKDGLYMSQWDTNMGEVAEAFLAYCAKDEQYCGRYFRSRGIAEVLKEVLQKIDDESTECGQMVKNALRPILPYDPKTDTPASVRLRMFMGRLLQHAITRQFIPVLIYRIDRCSRSDLQVVSHLVEEMMEIFNKPSEEDAFASELLYQLIVYSEYWESPSPTAKEMESRLLHASMAGGMTRQLPAYCVFTKDNSSACGDYATGRNYAASPISYKKDKYWNVAASPAPNASVLILSGKLDPQTPHKYAERLFKVLKTENKALVAFETATHGTLFSTGRMGEMADSCGLSVLAMYLKTNGSLKHLHSCASDGPPPVFGRMLEMLQPKFLSIAMDSDPYDGEFVDQKNRYWSSPSKSFKTGFIILIVLFVVSVVGGVVLAVKLRRARLALKSKDANFVEVVGS